MAIIYELLTGRDGPPAAKSAPTADTTTIGQPA
jgi:hypothetical protein